MTKNDKSEVMCVILLLLQRLSGCDEVYWKETWQRDEVSTVSHPWLPSCLVSPQQMQWSSQHIQHRPNQTQHIQILSTNFPHMPHASHKPSSFTANLEVAHKYVKMPTDMSSAWGRDERENRGEGNVVLGVLIVGSLSVFYVTTTHCFSSTYGWATGMCFLSLVLMTWVTSLTLHMLARDGPTNPGSENLKDGFCNSVVWVKTLNFNFSFLAKWDDWFKAGQLSWASRLGTASRATA